MKNRTHTVKRLAAAVLCSLFVLPAALSAFETAGATSQADAEKKSYYKNDASVFTKEPAVVNFKTEDPPDIKEENYVTDLDGEWKMTGDGKISELKDGAGWDNAINATVPGSIHTALFEAGVIDDPYAGDNMKNANKYGEKNWYYLRKFDYNGTGKNVKLCFEGVCNVADFYLNGKQIGSHEGMFGGPYIDVTDAVKKGENTLVVHLKPAKDYTRTVVFNCSYGWHYAKLYPLGIWQSVSIVDEPRVTLDHPFITTTDYKKGTVDLAIDAVSKDGGAVKGELTVMVVPKNFDGRSSYFKVNVNESGSALLRYRADVPDAHLWWPNGYGEQYLYELKTYFKADDGSSYYTESQFGIRQLDYAPLQPKETSGSYNRQFVINGVKVYMKGAGWCTIDAMMRFTREDYDRILSRAHDANINFFRSWGGGLVETDEFYDLCDEYGICIYQEWPCCWDSTKTQPADVLYETVIYGAKRLRNRPSLVVWGGGNEGDALYSDKVLNNMGKLTYETDGTRDFWRQDGGPGASNIRHDHIWWSGDSPEHYIKIYTGTEYLNMHEYGLGAMMNRQSIAKFAAEKELSEWPIKPDGSIAYHTATFNGFYGWMQTPYGHDIATHVHYASLFTDEESLDGIILGSQMSQAQADYPLAINQRIKADKNSANVIYKMNDNYPGASWSIVDWYGAPKIAYYLMQDAYRTEMAAFKADKYNTIDEINGSSPLSLPVYILDDTVLLKGKTTSVVMTAYDENLQIVKTEEFSGKTGQTVNSVGDFKLTSEQTYHTPLIITADLYVGGEFYNRTYMYYNYEYESGCLFYLPRTELQYSVSGNMVTIKNTGNVPAIGVSLKTSKEDTFVCSDNYFILTPDQSVTVTVNDAKLFTGVDCFNFKDAKDVTPPSAPSDVKVSDVKHDSVRVSWTASEDDNGIFKYEIKAVDGDMIIKDTVHGTKTEITLTGLPESTEFNLTVMAIDNNGNTAGSGVVTFKTSKDTTKPTLQSADFTDDGKIRLVFDTEMNKVRAEDISHYMLNNGGEVTAATLANDGKTVYLDISNIDESKSYTLGVIGLTDTKLNKNDTGYVAVTVERDLYMSVDFETDEDGASYTSGKHVATVKEINGAAKFTRDGAQGSALSVNGTSGVIVGGVGFSFPENSSVSLCIKGKAMEGFNILLAKGPKESGHFEFYTRSGALWCYAPDIGDIDLKYNINDGPDGWRRLAFVRQDGKLTVYDGGTQVSSVPFRGVIAEKDYDMSFGVLNEGSLGFGGSIDSVRLYQRILSPEELSEPSNNDAPTVKAEGNVIGKKTKTAFSLAENSTMNLWFRQDSEKKDYAVLFAKSNKNSDRHFEIYTNDGALYFFAPGANNGAAFPMKADLNRYIGSWHMLTLVHNEGKLTVYIDGGQVFDSPVSWAVADEEDYSFFGRLVEGGLDFPGSITETAFEEKALSQKEIEALYRSKLVYPEKPGGIGFEADLIELEPNESAPSGVKVTGDVGCTLTVKGDAAAIDGLTVNAKKEGEAVICASSDSGKYIAMTLVRVAEKAEETEPLTDEVTEPVTTEKEEEDTTGRTEEKTDGKNGWVIPVVIIASVAVAAVIAVAAVMITKKKAKK